MANHRTFEMHEMGGLWRKVHGKVWGMTCQTCHFTLHPGSCAMGFRSPLRFHIWPLPLDYPLVFSQKKDLEAPRAQMIFRKKTPDGRLTHSWIRPIMSYLWNWPGDATFFLYHASIQSKKGPAPFYFWHLRLGLFKSLFWLVKLNMCVCTLLQGVFCHVFCNLGARWHKILEFVPSCPIVDDDATFFPVGPTFEE